MAAAAGVSAVIAFYFKLVESKNPVNKRLNMPSFTCKYRLLSLLRNKDTF